MHEGILICVKVSGMYALLLSCSVTFISYYIFCQVSWNSTINLVSTMVAMYRHFRCVEAWAVTLPGSALYLPKCTNNRSKPIIGRELCNFPVSLKITIHYQTLHNHLPLSSTVVTGFNTGGFSGLVQFCVTAGIVAFTV